MQTGKPRMDCARYASWCQDGYRLCCFMRRGEDWSGYHSRGVKIIFAENTLITATTLCRSPKKALGQFLG
jgi:hypothetical protein